jgi:hypothetical protein
MPGVKWNKCLFGEQLLEATAYLSHVTGICIWMWNVYLKMCTHLAAHVSCSKCVYPIAHHRPSLGGWGGLGLLTCSPLPVSPQPPQADWMSPGHPASSSSP